MDDKSVFIAGIIVGAIGLGVIGSIIEAIIGRSDDEIMLEQLP